MNSRPNFIIFYIDRPLFKRPKGANKRNKTAYGKIGSKTQNFLTSEQDRNYKAPLRFQFVLFRLTTLLFDFKIKF